MKENIIQKTSSDYMADLSRLAYKYNAEDFHVFIDFSGHVKKVNIKVYCGGWGNSKEPDLERNFYTDYKNSYHEVSLREAILSLTKLHRIWRKHGVANLEYMENGDDS